MEANFFVLQRHPVIRAIENFLSTTSFNYSKIITEAETLVTINGDQQC